MKKELLFIFVIIFSITLSSTEIFINEILYNPSDSQGSDTNGEWIEIYNNGEKEINLTGWILKDKGSKNSTLYGILNPDSYAIIADNITNFNKIWNCSCLVIEGTLGLANSQDEIWIWNNSTLEDYINYTNTASEGESIQLINESWFNNIPNPCSKNNYFEIEDKEENLSLFYQEKVNCSQNFSISILSSNFADSFYDIKIDILSLNGTRIGKFYDGNEWISTNYYFESALIVDNKIGNTSIIFKIENFDGNAILNPKIRKTNSTSSKEFNNKNISVECNFTQQNQTSNQTQNQTEEKQKDSYLEILDYDKNVNFGSSFKLKLKFYKGDTRKYAIYIYVEDSEGEKASEKSTLYLREKYKLYELEVPIELNDNCDSKLKEGNGNIIIEGLNLEEKVEINIEKNEECEAEETNNQEKNKSATLNLSEEDKKEEIQETNTEILTEFNNPLTGFTVYENENMKISENIAWILSIVVLLFCIIIILKIKEF